MSYALTETDIRCAHVALAVTRSVARLIDVALESKRASTTTVGIALVLVFRAVCTMDG